MKKKKKKDEYRAGQTMSLRLRESGTTTSEMHSFFLIYFAVEETTVRVGKLFQSCSVPLKLW